MNNSLDGQNQTNRNHSLLHGVTLEMILDYFLENHGYEWLAERIRVKCFSSNPSKQSSLKFLRKTEWARIQLQGLYIKTVRETGKSAMK